MEEAAFLGDWSFFDHLYGFISIAAPLISGAPIRQIGNRPKPIDRQTLLESTFRLTPFGESVLTGNEDFTSRNSVDFWWGGTHIKNSNLWRWDTSTRKVLIS